ncbi:V-type ATP synthase subunit I [Treponema primitia]|uniref:V-type ATP synthase subunit I n=1 Tax=Treponema primitia TaxID=88058 RepID=UPI00397F30BD
MIVPMKKVSLVIQDKTQIEALTKLRELGVVHLERKNVSSDSLSKVFERKTRVETAQGLLRQYKAPPKKKPDTSKGWVDRKPVAGVSRGRRAADILGKEDSEFYSIDAINAPERPDLVNLLVGWGKDLKAYQDRLAFLARETTRLKNWGSFTPESLRDLGASGVNIYLYELIPSAFVNLPEDTKYILKNRDKGSVRIIVFDKELPGVSPIQLPEKSLSELNAEAAELPGKIAEIEGKLKNFADRKSALDKEMAIVQGRIDFEVARATLELVDDIPEDLAVSYFSGFAPQEDVGLLKRAAAENNWALIADDPEPDEEVPTKLKNNKLVSLLYPLTDFLETVPGYHEVDISGWFLFFFCIFFGMIFGDAGYGLILFATALFGIFKTAKKGTPPIFKMMLLLSISNVIWGILTCSWFGLPLEMVPGALKNISLPLISSAEAAKSPEASALVDQNLQIFCFSLALLQLSIAHVIGIIRNIKEKSLKFFADLGNLAMLFGMYNVVLFLVVSNDYRPIPFLPQSMYLLIGGFVLVFVFGSYEGSILRSLGASFSNIISVILGITNVFSDIMSYIRLWAVGLAGASIASTVNSMVGPLLGSFLVFLGLVLLCFGHGLNLVLNVLSVLVHGVRLNTLEFSSHLGLTWSGTAYRPFAETAKK